MKTTSTPPADPGNMHEQDYTAYLDKLHRKLLDHPGPLFETATDGLWETYLNSFPPGSPVRQHHNCNCCRQFIERYGGLVAVDATDRTYSVLWRPEDTTDPDLSHAIRNMYLHVNSRPILRPFISKHRELGRRQTGPWQHLSTTNPQPFKSAAKAAHEAAAEKVTEFHVTKRALTEYKPSTLAIALQLVNSETLYRSEKVREQLVWFNELKTATHHMRNKARRDNLIWRAVASAPAGFCHIRASVLATLLDDIEAGKPIDSAAAAFKQKMHPLQYQRPTADPTDGQISAAEALVEQLGVTPSLERRMARLDEVLPFCFWKPTEPNNPATGGVFQHLRETKHQAHTLPPAPPMSWDKFRRTLLPTAEQLELHIKQSMPYFAFTTAVNPTAMPIFQWPNTFSHYFYTRVVAAYTFNLQQGYVKVLGICDAPHTWDGCVFNHLAPAAFFLLQGAKDLNEPNTALFPEHLRADLRPVRAVIEAHCRRTKLQDAGGPYAAGCGWVKNGNFYSPFRLRLTFRGTCQTFTIDRWD